jgi:hypothetical protein
LNRQEEESLAAVVVTVAWVPLALAVFEQTDLKLGVGSASPLLGVGLLTTEIVHASPAEWPVRAGWAVFWIVSFSAIALGLLWATLASFDRCVGRIDGSGSGRSPKGAAPAELSGPNHGIHLPVSFK